MPSSNGPPTPPTRGIEPILVSACLLGSPCTYQGTDERDARLIEALDGLTIVPVCPEVAGGLPTPRPRGEIDGGDGAAVLDGHARVRDGNGHDLSPAYILGAERTLDVALRSGARLALLKDRSPSCGSAGVYDGTHTRTLRDDGQGVTAALLRRHGITVATEHDTLPPNEDRHPPA